MQYRTLGTSDLKVSVIGLGTNNFGNPQRQHAPRRFGISDPSQSVAVVHAALDAGVNLIDTADLYGDGRSEEHIGLALKGRREQAVLATKFNLAKLEGESIAERINRSLEASLTRLGTEYVDLYQLHFPVQGLPQEAVLEPLARLVADGKVRAIGACNYAGWRHAVADAASEKGGFPRFVSAQNYYNVLRRQVEGELLPFCTERGVGFLPYFPLAGGWLTGKYRPADTPSTDARRMVTQLQKDEAARRVLEELTAFAEGRGHTILELAFAWLLAHPAVSSVIAGAMTPEQVTANAAASEWVLTDEERDAADAIARWDGTDEEIEGFGPGFPQVRIR
jgi:aryl-alcohol dehydrogenase-like predicted oxidoreductase